MVIKLYISGISGNKEVKKKQQRVQMILDSKQIDYEAIDITEPGKEKDKEFMQQNGKVRESLGKHPLPPQIFNDEDFCGDYEDFDLANEVDELEKFLHIETSAKDGETDTKESEDSKSMTEKQNLSVDSMCNPYEYHTFKIKYDGVNGLKEQIIDAIDAAEENNETEEVTKSEVNGEREAVLEPSSENITENVEASPEEVAPEKEESSTPENKENNDNIKKESGENLQDEEEPEDEGEAAEGGKIKEDIEAPKEEKVENEETSPSEEEEKGNVEEKEYEEKKENVESEKEEKEEDESEKSQEE